MTTRNGVCAFFLVYILTITSTTATSCGGVVNIISYPKGIITSPNYPDQYPGSVSCTWIFKAPQGERVQIDFSDFDVTGSEDCKGDYVGVTKQEGGDEERYCGSVPPTTIVSQGNTLTLSFNTNAVGSCRGFNLSYVVREDSFTCGDTTDALEFIFQSPDYPSSLNNDSLECVITVDHGCSEVYPSPICQIRLDLEDFEIQPPYWGDCLYDKFYAESTSPLPYLCGVNNGSHMYINVEGRSKTDLTFILKEIEFYLYHCYDIYGHHLTEEDDEEPPPPSPTSPHERRKRSHRERSAPTWNPEIGTLNPDFIRPKEDYDQERQNVANVSSTEATTTTTTTTETETTTNGDVTVALYNYKDNEMISFPTRRAWKIRVTQIPCNNCPRSRKPKAPDGCLQYYEGITGEIKSFNFDGYGCYSEDRWCDFKTIKHVSDCDIRIGYTGHLNNLDYGICFESESGFCGIQYSQVDEKSFSLTNVSDFSDEKVLPQGQVGDMGCMADYMWVPGAVEDDHGDTYERYCGTLLGTSIKQRAVTSYSKPFLLRMVTDPDEYSLTNDYMNRGFHLQYNQIPCRLAGK